MAPQRVGETVGVCVDSPADMDCARLYLLSRWSIGSRLRGCSIRNPSIKLRNKPVILEGGRKNAIMLAATLALVVLSFANAAQAQPSFYPEVIGPTEPALTPPPPGQPPPIGDGPVPAPVTPGMLGNPDPPASQVYIGEIPPGPQGKQEATSRLGGMLQPPTNFVAADPGTLPGPMDFKPPPAAVVNINPDGGMPGDQAPQNRWGAQTTRDFGRSPNTVYGPGSQLCDFGELLPNKPNLKMMPQFSQDGPRNCQYIQQRGSNNRSGNFPNAQETQDLNGNRTLFKGPNLRAQFTIAPY